MATTLAASFSLGRTAVTAGPHAQVLTSRGKGQAGRLSHVSHCACRQRVTSVCSMEPRTASNSTPSSSSRSGLMDLPSGVLGLVLQNLADGSTQSRPMVVSPRSRELSSSIMLGSLALAAVLSLASNEPASAAEVQNALSSVAGTSGDVNPTMSLAFIPGMGPSSDGPFWDNVLRFVVYFVTVFTGGLATLVKPIVDLAKNPITLFLLVVVLGGGFALTYLTLSAMLGLGDADASLYSY